MNIDILNIEHTIAKDLLVKNNPIYKVFNSIGDYILEVGNSLGDEYIHTHESVWIHRSVTVSNTSTIEGPAIIGEGSVIRPGAYIRENVIIGKNVIIGNSCEIKNSIIFDECLIPHFNYVGDSIIGYKGHLGAGVITSNFRYDKENIKVNGIDTGLNKLGSIIGDYADIGCNSVLCPGSIIGKNTIIYPLTMVRGIIPSDSIMKDKNTIVAKINKKDI